jgi:hypothetical protein
MSKAPSPDCDYFTNAFGGAVTGSEPSGGQRLPIAMLSSTPSPARDGVPVVGIRLLNSAKRWGRT